MIARLSGFTERETLQTWTVPLGAMEVVGLLQVLIVATLLPLMR